MVVSEATGCADDDYFEEVYEVISLKTKGSKCLFLNPLFTDAKIIFQRTVSLVLAIVLRTEYNQCYR